MKQVTQEYVEAMPLDQVETHPENPREGDVGAIYESIEHHGFYGTILVQRSTGHILAGNHRYMAAREAGAKSLPAIIVDVDDDQARRIMLVDNRTNDLAAYNDSELRDVLETLREQTGNLLGTGYTGDDLDDLIALLEGPPDLDDLAGQDEQGGDGTTLTLKVTPHVASLWKAHASEYTTDSDALEDLLGG